MPLPSKKTATIVQWMYNEIDFDYQARTFSHDILFGNGWESGLRFRDVEMIVAHDLLPTKKSGQASVARTA